MVDATHTKFSAGDRSYFSLIKKEIHQKAVELGIPQKRVAEVDLIVAEITSNLYKYANDGEILVGSFYEEGNPYLEIICIDNGPGIANPSKMILDGFSSSNTLGHGLGSIKRLSDTFDLYSLTDWGTILLSRVYATTPAKNAKGVFIRPIVLSKPGETTSGDGFFYKSSKDVIKLMLCDGLGHGPEANLAVNEAEKNFRVCPDNDPVQTLRFLHGTIKRTRGMVANMVCLDLKNRTWTSAGIGNIGVRWLGPNLAKNHMSYNGIVGHNIPNTMNSQQYSVDEYNQVVMASDGIKTRWELSKYPMIQKCDPSILAAAIYKDHARQTDDMSVVVIRYK
ncbi:ATP-binding SpoIIE family protein phosphatase [Pedobacter namyangjuensis]|uniref:ATP-binding SpoIIE family protein phosphatase n=1 Tax=Pedobacter namyangjuensis TaxID=600626 RepID=UPI000DE563D4|nr:ATP-binding SpoIIE family protein phosphatase [Pedobacter namyangjuensis]